MKLLIKLFAAIPFPLIQVMEKVLFFLLYYVIQYRRKQTVENLTAAFPEKSKAEIEMIEKQYYLNFTSFILEVAKTPGMKKEEMNKRNIIVSNEDYRHFLKQEKPAIILTAHFFNWEWAGLAVGNQSGKKTNVVYKPLRNESADETMREIRSQYGARAVAMKNIFRVILEEKDQPTMNCFLADQTPTRAEAGIWLPFFSRMAPFFNGHELIARKAGLPVYFAWPRKSGQNTYRIQYKMITEDASTLPKNEVMKAYVSLLEEAILQNPETWLWSHNRWKHEYFPKEKSSEVNPS